jgi:hypothetical protein
MKERWPFNRAKFWVADTATQHRWDLLLTVGRQDTGVRSGNDKNV